MPQIFCCFFFFLTFSLFSLSGILCNLPVVFLGILYFYLVSLQYQYFLLTLQTGIVIKFNLIVSGPFIVIYVHSF